METLNIQLQPFFEWLLRTTLQAGLLICLILLVQIILRGRLGIRWHYFLWLLLLVRMVMPWSPQSRMSMYNLIPKSVPKQQIEDAKPDISNENVSPDATITGTDEPIPASTGSIVQENSDSAGEFEQEPTPILTTEVTAESTEPLTVTPPVIPKSNGRFRASFSEIVNILPVVWLTGALVLAVYVCASNFNLWRIVKRRHPLTDQKILDLLEDCKDQMGIQTILGIVPTDKVKSPALFGFVRPRLLLPQGMIETLSRDELRYILLHELAHLKRHDIYIGWLMSLLQVLHWFNPLIWLAFYRMRADRELACDALVLARTQSGKAKDYGRIVVELVERFSQSRRLPAMAGILESKSQLKRRITMIAQFKKNSYQWSPLSVILIILLACVSLPDAERAKALGDSTLQSSPIVLRRIWSGPDVDCYGAPSPDGRYLSYVDWNTSDLNHNDLAIYEITTGKRRRLTDNASWYKSDKYQFALSSIWSPDSKQIAYQWWSDVIELCIIGIDGSRPRILYGSEEWEWVRPYDWSPDGRHILACVAGKDGKNRIVLVSATDGAVRILKTLDKYYGLRDSSWYTPKNMTFSPDGLYIVYDFPQKEDSHDIALMSTDGSREVPLVKHPANDHVLGWTPDGKNILFASDRTGNECVWLMAVADGEPHGIPELVKADIKNFGPMGLTDDGSFYYSRNPGSNKNDIYITEVAPETGKVVVPPYEAIKSYIESNTTPDYSPDGKYLAYISRRPPPLKMLNRNTHLGNVLCVRSLETGEEREFKPEINNFGFPQWSPDSRSIMVANFEDDNKHAGLYQVDAQTGKIKLLVTSENNRIHGHLWNADGKSIFLVRSVRMGDQDKHFCQIVVRDIESGVEDELYRGGRSDIFSISLSRDGKWLAFLDRAERRTLRIMPAVGGEPREIHILDKHDNRYIPHTWTADGKYILMPKLRALKSGEKWDLWRIPVYDGEPQNLGFELAPILQLSAHPDDQHIAFCTTTPRPAEVWVMENFLPEMPVVKPASQITLRQVWSGPDADAYGTVSADGRYLSHTDWNNGDLAVRELVTGKTRLLTETKKGGKENFRFALNSAISPDNKQIAYSWTNQHGLYDLCVIGIDGSGDRTLYSKERHEIYPASWSSDGKRIAARRYASGIDIVSVSVADGSLQVLKTSKQIYWPQFCYSPDDQFIVYDFPVAKDGENYDISLIRADGSGEIPLITHPANDRLLGWIPGSNEVLFRSDRAGSHDIWAMRVVDGKVQGPPITVTRDVGEISPNGFTRDGSFYFSRYKRRFTSQTFAFNAQTGKIQEQSAKPLLGSNFSPAWSPDGRYLAYVEEQTATAGPGWHYRPLHIRDVETGEDRTLAEEFGIRSPRWSPDGRFLLIIGKQREKRYNGGVYEVDVNDGRMTELVQFPRVEKWSRDIWSRSVAEWAADGKTIFYTSRGRIIRRELESGQEKPLFQHDNLTRALDVSPDGATLVFGIGLSGEGYGQVMSIPVSGGQPTELCRFQESKGGLRVPRQLVWSPDGDYILFARSEEKGSTVLRVPAVGGEPEAIWRLQDQVTDLSVHPNGKEIAVSTFLQETPIWVMENFLPEVVASIGN